jgi:hypothetical protein
MMNFLIDYNLTGDAVPTYSFDEATTTVIN